MTKLTFHPKMNEAFTAIPFLLLVGLGIHHVYHTEFSVWNLSIVLYLIVSGLVVVRFTKKACLSWIAKSLTILGLLFMGGAVGENNSGVFITLWMTMISGYTLIKIVTAYVNKKLFMMAGDAFVNTMLVVALVIFIDFSWMNTYSILYGVLVGIMFNLSFLYVAIFHKEEIPSVWDAAYILGKVCITTPWFFMDSKK